MPLTDTAARNAKPTDKPRKLADGGGLYLLVSTNGGRYWRMDYRYSGRRKTLALGVYPDVSLKTARERRDEARKLLADRIDPGAQRKARKAARTESAASSFEVVAREWQPSIHPIGATRTKSGCCGGWDDMYSRTWAPGRLPRLLRPTCWP